MNFTAETESATFRHTAGNEIDIDALRRLADSVTKDFTVFLYDRGTTAFHRYEFEYDGCKPVRPWTYNNIGWSLCNKDTVKNMADAFPELLQAINAELDK